MVGTSAERGLFCLLIKYKLSLFQDTENCSPQRIKARLFLFPLSHLLIILFTLNNILHLSYNEMKPGFRDLF